MKVGVRSGTNEDVPFIMRRMLKDLRGSDFARAVPNPLYFLYEHRAWEHHLTSSLVRVAYPLPQSVASGIQSGDHRRILGFLVCQPSDLGLIVHYCYTRRSVNDDDFEIENHRRQGIARTLIESVIKDYEMDPDCAIIYTKRTAQFYRDRDFRDYVAQNDRLQHNPYLFFTLLPDGWETGIKRAPSYEPVHV